MAAEQTCFRTDHPEDIQGDVHMHTVETDGRNTIEEMADAARAHGYKYMAITDHSKNLAFANGLDDKRAVAHSTDPRGPGKHGRDQDFCRNRSRHSGRRDARSLRWCSAQMDIVIASVHSHFNQEPAEMTERLLKAMAQSEQSLLGHPTGRQLLRRDEYTFDMDAVLKAAAKNKIAMELNAYPDGSTSATSSSPGKRQGVKIVINTDAHHTSHMEKIRYGVLQARRAWLTKEDVLNTLPAEKFAKAMKHDW